MRFWKEDIKDKKGNVLIKAGWHYREKLNHKGQTWEQHRKEYLKKHPIK